MNRNIFSLTILILCLSLSIAEPAPDFTLKDVNGKAYKLSDYKGKIVVLEWINFGCPFVKKHYNSGNMQQLQTKYREKEVVWFSICSSAEGKQGYYFGEELQSLINEHNANPTAYLIDADGKVGRLYGAKTTPHMFVVDVQSELVYSGAIDSIPSWKIADVKIAKNYVQMVVDALLAGKKSPVTSNNSYGCSVKYRK